MIEYNCKLQCPFDPSSKIGCGSDIRGATDVACSEEATDSQGVIHIRDGGLAVDECCKTCEMSGLPVTGLQTFEQEQKADSTC